VLDLGPPKRRVLAVRLLLEEGRPVSTDRLCEDLWAGRPPSRAVASLQAHISRLRAVLEPARPPHGKSGLLVRESHGYALRIPSKARDTVRFERGVAQAGRSLSAGRVSEARREIEHALSLWRGAALEDARDHLFAARHAAQLEEGRVAAEELRICTLMHHGDVNHAVSAAEALTAQYPLREVAWGLLLCALYLTGRHADALARFEELRKHLSEELGLQPSPSVSSLQQAILRHDLGFIQHSSRSIVTAGYDSHYTPRVPRIGVTGSGGSRSARLPGPADATTPERGAAAPAPYLAPPQVRSALSPAQLPAAPAYFTGRRTELDALAELLPEPSDHGAVDATAAPVTVIGGAPGIGKTTLVLRFAHRIAERFPDGQLFADLRGFDPSDRAAEPAEILQKFLTSLGVPSGAVPSCTTARTALLRTLLSRRSVLFVLDNARDEEQVRPLLPGACL
jgi:DNA-binding SARP family transcriptional activator